MDYLTINEHKTTNTTTDDEFSPYDEGWADGATGGQSHPTLRNDLSYRQGYVKGIVAYMREVADAQRGYVDPSTGFDWF
jgi:hypothetical protein